MHGAHEFALLFGHSKQIGKLYLDIGSHARGKTFHIYVLPKHTTVNNLGDLRKCDAIEVYGIISDNPGWSEKYGWLHEGVWQDDFKIAIEDRRNEVNKKEKSARKSKERKLEEEKKSVLKIYLVTIKELIMALFKRVYSEVDYHTFDLFRMRAKNEGLTISQALGKLIKAYNNGKISFGTKSVVRQTKHFNYMSEAKKWQF